MNSQFPQTDRERCMEALRTVLGAIPGVKKVYRHGEVPDNVPESKLPAIILVEDDTEVKQFSDPRRFMLKFKVAASFITKAQKTAAAPEGNVSTVRDAFAMAILNTLIHNPNLTVQLADEDAAVAHCYSVGEGGNYDIEYDNEAPFPYVSGAIAFEVRLVSVFDDRAREIWETLIIEGTPEPLGDEDSLDSTQTTDPFTIADPGFSVVVES